jgi:hypothetical protein
MHPAIITSQSNRDNQWEVQYCGRTYTVNVYSDGNRGVIIHLPKRRIRTLKDGPLKTKLIEATRITGLRYGEAFLCNI